MKTPPHWRAVGYAMRWARKQDGVIIDVTSMEWPDFGASVTDHRWIAADGRSVIVEHAPWRDHVTVDIGTPSFGGESSGSDVAQILRVLAALDLIPALLAEVRDERYARCVCKRVLFWRPETPELPARWRHLDRRAYIEGGLHRAEVAE